MSEEANVGTSGQEVTIGDVLAAIEAKFGSDALIPQRITILRATPYEVVGKVYWGESDEYDPLFVVGELPSYGE